MLFEVTAQAPATAPAGWPLRLSDLPAAVPLCRQRRLHSGLCRRPHDTISFVTRIQLFPYSCQERRSRFLFVASATDSTPPAPISANSSGKNIVLDEGFSPYKISFGVIGLAIGGTLLSYGFGAYFTILPGSEWSALMLTYGFPLAIIGMALKYAELKPVPCMTYSDAQSLRESCATPILKQVRNDVTRFRYGDEQHLDEALKRVFHYGQGGGILRRNGPILQMIREEMASGSGDQPPRCEAITNIFRSKKSKSRERLAGTSPLAAIAPPAATTPPVAYHSSDPQIAQGYSYSTFPPPPSAYPYPPHVYYTPSSHYSTYPQPLFPTHTAQSATQPTPPQPAAQLDAP